MAEGGLHFDLARVVQRTFGVMGRNFGPFTLLALVFSGVPAALSGAFSTSLAMEMATGNPTAIAGYTGFILLALATSYILMGALTHGTIVDLNGRRAGFGECLSTGLANVVPLVGIALIIVAAAMVVGFVAALLIGVVSGIGGAAMGAIAGLVFGAPAVVFLIILFIRWSVAAPAYLVEKPGVTGALRRSAELTKGHRWAIFVLLLCYVVLATAIQFAVLIPAGALSGATMVGAMSPSIIAFTVIYSVINALIGAVGVSALYYELRTVKDGVSAESLASIFS